MTHHRLLRPQQFIDLRGDDALLLLDMNPQLFSSANKMEEGAPLGCLLVTSHYLVGKIVIFEEAPVPLGWMIERLHGFLSYCLERGELIGDGETFGDEDGEWVILVRHAPPEKPELPGEVHLKVLYSKEHGIDVRNEAQGGGTAGAETGASARPEPLAQPAPQPMTQPMAEQPMPPMGATAHGGAEQQPGMGFGGADERPVFGKRAAPSTGGGSPFPERAALFGAAVERKEQSARNWLQVLAARLGMSASMTGVLVGAFVLVFLMKGVIPFLFG